MSSKKAPDKILTTSGNLNFILDIDLHDRDRDRDIEKEKYRERFVGILERNYRRPPTRQLRTPWQLLEISSLALTCLEGYTFSSIVANIEIELLTWVQMVSDICQIKWVACVVMEKQLCCHE